jgi:hypothetical protein
MHFAAPCVALQVVLTIVRAPRCNCLMTKIRRVAGRQFGSTRPLPQRGSLDSSFHLGQYMRNLFAIAFGTGPLLATGVALAQNGNMMNNDGGMWGTGWMGGYGGIWVPILLVIVAVGFVALLIQRKGK